MKTYSATCPQDVNGDGSVNVSDLLAVLSAWGVCIGCPEDIDSNGIVDVSDLLQVLSVWGAPCLDSGTFPIQWNNGSPTCNNGPGGGPPEPPIHVHQYNDNLYILRQSICTNLEANFMYLLFGTDKALLLDTGAGGIPIATTVYGIIDDWLVENNKAMIDLVVIHSHSHSDHISGDSQFIGQPNTTVVGTSVGAVIKFFGFTNWPNIPVTFDLGGRIIDVIPTPGHHPAHITLYDSRTGLLLTGDSFYPGLLLLFDFPVFLASTQRMVDFITGRPCTWVLGAHINMSNTPGFEYPFNNTFHPDEHPLQLTRNHLQELLDALIAMQLEPFFDIHDDFIIFPF